MFIILNIDLLSICCKCPPSFLILYTWVFSFIDSHLRVYQFYYFKKPSFDICWCFSIFHLTYFCSNFHYFWTFANLRFSFKFSSFLMFKFRLLYLFLNIGVNTINFPFTASYGSPQKFSPFFLLPQNIFKNSLLIYSLSYWLFKSV